MAAAGGNTAPLLATQKSECVRVVVRCRPMSTNEQRDKYEKVVDMDVKKGMIELRNPKPGPGEKPKEFAFDAVYDIDSKQRDLYDETFFSLVQSCLDGYNATIFAYGQTGTGKTYTMQGLKDKVEERGVIPNSFEQIFAHIKASHDQQYLVRASYLEIYQEEVRDLLHRDQNKRLELKERPDTGTYVKDLSTLVTKGIAELEQVMNIGNQNRATGATNMNEQSSRSHAILIITVECSHIGPDGKEHIRVGKLNLVDLAGSERQSKTGATGERLQEATKINLSLSALGNVIGALVDSKRTHVPYRDSKLTRLLQDSLGGNSKTVMVANVGPASYNYDETLSTLRYANRAKQIKNQPRVNEDPKDALLREFQEEIARLKTHLATRGAGGLAGRRASGDDENDEDIGDDAAAVEDYMNEQRAKLEQETSAILNNHSLIASEKERLVSALDERKRRLNEEREAADQLSEKIKTMESKLLVGADQQRDIEGHTAQQERDLAERRRLIAEQKQREREMQQALMAKEEFATELAETYTSLKDEVDAKTRKLAKLAAKRDAAKQELAELAEEHRRQRSELEDTQTTLQRELRLRQLIIESFVPAADVSRLQARAMYVEDEDNWHLQPTGSEGGTTGAAALRADAATNGEDGSRRRGITEFARIAASVSGNPRYRHENILLLELDMPARTTSDYSAPVIAPQVQAALEAALADEEGDLELIAGRGGGGGVRGLEKTRRAPSRAAKSARRQSQQQEASSSTQPPQDTGKSFPMPRGLVTKDR